MDESVTKVPGERAGHLTPFALAAIVLFALVLRTTGVGFMLPHLTEPDGNVFVTQLDVMRTGEAPEKEPLAAFYPTLVTRIAKVFAAGSYRDPLPPDAPLAAHLAQAASDYVLVRTVVAVLSVLLVPATFLLARRFLDTTASLLAALFTATSVLHVWFAQEARPHSAAAALALLAVVAALNLRRRGQAIDYVVAGLAAGLAIGSLQSGAVVLPAMLVAVVQRSSAARRASAWWIVALLGVVAVCVSCFYPSLFYAHSERQVAASNPGPTTDLFGHWVYWDHGRKAVYFFGHLIYGELFQGEGFPVVWKTLCDYEPWMLALSIIGALLVITSAFRRRTPRDSERTPRDSERTKDLVVVLAYAIPYLVLIGLYARTYQRFVIPLLPYLSCLAAYGVARIVCGALSLSSARARGWLAALALSILLTPQVFAAIAVVRFRRAADTGTRAARWIGEHLNADTDRIVLQYPLELPVFSTPASLAESNGMLDDRKHPWHLYQRQLGDAARSDTAWNLVQIPLETPALREKFEADPVGCLQALHGTYAAIDVYDEGRRPIILNSVRPALRELGERVARFIPYGDETGNNLPLSYQDDEFPEGAPTFWWWEALTACSAGPVVEIYKLR